MKLRKNNEVEKMPEKQVLVVENELIVAKDIQDSLNQIGYIASDIASTGEQALEIAEKTRPDLILMNIKLDGGMDGIETAQKVQGELDIPVIFLIAYADENTLQRAKKTQLYGYLIKPFEQRELYSILEMAYYKHKMEKQLKESEEKFKRIFEAIPDLFFLVSSNGTILDHKSNEKFLYIPQEAFIGKKMEDILPTEVAEISSKTVIKTIETQQPQMIEYKHLIKGKACYFEARYLFFSKSQVAIFIQEITDRKEAEFLIEKEINKLKEQDKIIGDLNLKVAYELKTMLVSIYGASDLILAEYKDQLGKTALELIEMINNGSKRMKGLVDKILGISQDRIKNLGKK